MPCNAMHDSYIHARQVLSSASALGLGRARGMEDRSEDDTGKEDPGAMIRWKITHK
jgi:hypothetical protein